MLCNVQLSQLSKTLSKLDLKIGEDFDILTVSIDPKDETSSEAKRFCRTFAAQHERVMEGWLVLHRQ